MQYINKYILHILPFFHEELFFLIYNINESVMFLDFLAHSSICTTPLVIFLANNPHYLCKCDGEINMIVC